MAITQDRMIALIQAAKAYKLAYAELAKIVIDVAKELGEGKITLGEAARQVDTAARFNYPSPNHGEVISLEEFHFQKSFKRNTTKRLAAQAKYGFQPLRRADNIPQAKPPVEIDQELAMARAECFAQAKPDYTGYDKLVVGPVELEQSFTEGEDIF